MSRCHAYQAETALLLRGQGRELASRCGAVSTSSTSNTVSPCRPILTCSRNLSLTARTNSTHPAADNGTGGNGRLRLYGASVRNRLDSSVTSWSISLRCRRLTTSPASTAQECRSQVNVHGARAASHSTGRDLPSGTSAEHAWHGVAMWTNPA